MLSLQKQYHFNPPMKNPENIKLENNLNFKSWLLSYIDAILRRMKKSIVKCMLTLQSRENGLYLWLHL